MRWLVVLSYFYIKRCQSENFTTKLTDTSKLAVHYSVNYTNSFWYHRVNQTQSHIVVVQGTLCKEKYTSYYHAKTPLAIFQLSAPFLPPWNGMQSFQHNARHRIVQRFIIVQWFSHVFRNHVFEVCSFRLRRTAHLFEASHRKPKPNPWLTTTYP